MNLAVILDMDGLMVDTESIYKRTWQQAARDLGCQLDDEASRLFGIEPARCVVLEDFG